MNKAKVILVSLLAISFMVCAGAPVYAKVNLDASMAQVTVPAERTQNIGPNFNGVIVGQAPLGVGNPIAWTAGQSYAQGNRIKMTLPDNGGDVLFADDWCFQYSASTGVPGLATYMMNASGVPTMIVQLNTNVIQNGDTIAIFGPSTAPTASGAFRVNVSALTGETVRNLQAVLLTSGLGTVDQKDSDWIVKTLYQYSNSYMGAATDTIDYINENGLLFLVADYTNTATAGTISNLGMVKIDSAAAFNVAGGETCNAPTFQSGDAIQITLDDDQMFQGLAQLLVIGTQGNAGATATWTRTLTQGVTSNVFTCTAAPVLNVINANAGLDDTDLQFNVAVVANGVTAMKTRTISVSDITMILNATGNGSRSLGNYGNVIVLKENSALYRCNFARNDATSASNQYYKFSNDSGQEVEIKVRYHDMDAQTAGTWVTLPDVIEEYGVLAIGKNELQSALGVAAGSLNGWVEFRLLTSPSSVTGCVNAKFGDTWFNVPIHLYDNDWGANIAPKYR